TGEIGGREIRSANIFASIHLHTIDDGQEIATAQAIAQCRLTQRLGDETVRMSGIEIVDFLAPAGKGRNLVLDGLLSVGNVVDLSTKCIYRVHAVPAVLWQ